MTKSKDYILVLWRAGFDEAAATIFITELREAGLLVKVVGLTPRDNSGARGLALVPDITLDQALSLASQTSCLIIPTHLNGQKHYYSDPRLSQFVKLIQARHALIVLGGFNRNAQINLGLSNSDSIIVYPKIEDLVRFARDIAHHFSSIRIAA